MLAFYISIHAARDYMTTVLLIVPISFASVMGYVI